MTFSRSWVRLQLLHILQWITIVTVVITSEQGVHTKSLHIDMYVLCSTPAAEPANVLLT